VAFFLREDHVELLLKNDMKVDAVRMEALMTTTTRLWSHLWAVPSVFLIHYMSFLKMTCLAIPYHDSNGGPTRLGTATT